jgi:hypothetical protein
LWEKNWQARYGKTSSMLDDEDVDVYGKLGKFNNAQFMVMPKVEAKKILTPKHVAKLRFWDKENLKGKIDFVIFHKQKTTKNGEPKKQIVPVCAIIEPQSGSADWRAWVKDALDRAKIPVIQLSQDDLKKDSLIDDVIVAMTKAPPIPDWTPDLIRASMAPKFPPEVLKN